MNLIDFGVFVGCAKAAKDSALLSAHKVALIVNLASTVRPTGSIGVVAVHLSDKKSADTADDAELDASVLKAVTAIDEAHAARKIVLVQCACFARRPKQRILTQFATVRFGRRVKVARHCDCVVGSAESNDARGRNCARQAAPALRAAERGGAALRAAPSVGVGRRGGSVAKRRVNHDVPVFAARRKQVLGLEAKVERKHAADVLAQDCERAQAARGE
jgi:hypothetical protein